MSTTKWALSPAVTQQTFGVLACSAWQNRLKCLWASQPTEDRLTAIGIVINAITRHLFTNRPGRSLESRTCCVQRKIVNFSDQPINSHYFSTFSPVLYCSHQANQPWRLADDTSPSPHAVTVAVETSEITDDADERAALAIAATINAAKAGDRHEKDAVSLRQSERNTGPDYHSRLSAMRIRISSARVLSVSSRAPITTIRSPGRDSATSNDAASSRLAI